MRFMMGLGWAGWFWGVIHDVVKYAFLLSTTLVTTLPVPLLV